MKKKTGIILLIVSLITILIPASVFAGENDLETEIIAEQVTEDGDQGTDIYSIDADSSDNSEVEETGGSSEPSIDVEETGGSSEPSIEEDISLVTEDEEDTSTELLARAGTYGEPLDTLLSRMIVNASYNNGYPYIQYTDVKGYTHTITYRNDIDRLIFHSKQGEYVVSFDYLLDNMTIYNSHISFSYLQPSYPIISITAAAPWDMSTYKLGDKLSFITDTSKSIRADSYDPDNLDHDENLAANTAITGWNQLLLENTLYSFKDLGFVCFYGKEDPKPTRINLDACKASLSKTSYTYNGKAKKPTVKVSYNGKKLTAGTDYTVTYVNNKNAGTASATIKGKGKYTGSRKLKFTIGKAANSITISKTKYNITYDAAKNQTIQLKPKVKGGSVTYSSNASGVTVTKKGKVTIKKGYFGKAVITVKAGSSNYKTVRKNVTIRVPETGILSNPAKLDGGKKFTKVWTTTRTNPDFYVSFKMASRGYATIKATKPFDNNGEAASYKIQMYDSKGNLVWDCDTDGQKNIPTMNYSYNVGLKKGTYTVQFTPYFRVTSTNVKSTVSVKTNSNAYWEIENNDSFDQATSIKLGKKYTAVFRENYGRKADYFKVKLSKGNTYKIQLGNYGALFDGSVIATVYNPNKLEADDAGGWLTCGYHLEIEGVSRIYAAETGYYYINIWNASRDAGTKYSVTVKKI